MFKDFLWKFRRLFTFRKFAPKGFPYFGYDNEIYADFMKQFMNHLEIRKFKKFQIIANEMEESLEVLFVEQGRYQVGYEINKKRFFRRQFGVSTNIGGFNTCFKKRYLFIYRAKTDMSCLAIRKETFCNICS